MNRTKGQPRTVKRGKRTPKDTATKIGEMIIELIQSNPDFKKDLQMFCEAWRRARVE